MLDADKYPRGPRMAERGRSPGPFGGTGPEPRLGEEGGSAYKVVRASMGSSDPILPARLVAPARRPTPGPANQIDLEVWLGSEPTHIDIDL
jgi:hypothetical protein